ncbi:MAG: UDP-N-acetylmuramate dehydrogenase [Proteobacteria bacterium]|nr:UDP-N-acetylmuramate dehydrogenase [Pseudomonadota bacterium]NCA28061.1 UDP-N-acetylmuramate dehydrogenase [Pseudomonadota bacterium]
MIDKSKLPIVRGQYKFDSKVTNWFDLDGRAEVLFKPKDLQDLSNFLKNIDPKIKIQVIGAGSNVIISDQGISGILIKLSSDFAKIIHDDLSITIGGASLCQTVAQYCKNYGLGGLEFLSGIPGTIGGAIAMNAGCYGSEISSTLIKAKAVDIEGNCLEINNSDFGFFYRGNNLAKKYIFIEGIFKINLTDKFLVSEKINQLQIQREASQPIRAKTGGSTFKNPPQKKAWELIDAVGFRGKKLGDAQFSSKHCNFLINTGKAKSEDLLNLGNEARKQIHEEFGIDLEWEIKELK